MADLYELKTALDSHGTFFCFSGPINHDLIVELGDTIKKRMTIEEASKTTILKAFSMFIEYAQNIANYSAEEVADPDLQNRGYRSGLISIGLKNGIYFVSSGNLVDNSKVDGLKEKLETLNNMDKDELKKHYKQKRKQERPDDSAGAGLGFIELARKSTDPLEYSFQKIDDDYSFFAIKTTV